MHEIKPIIDPLPREELLRELTPDRKVRDTKRAGNEIYIFTAAGTDIWTILSAALSMRQTTVKC